MTRRPNFRLAALAVTCAAFAGTNAAAQMPPPPPDRSAPPVERGGPPPDRPARPVERSGPPPERRVGPEGRPAPPPAIARADGGVVASGRMQRWLLNPNGEVDGLLLTDGTQVIFAPHLAGSAMQVVKPGETVQVSGWRAANAPVVRASALNANGREVADPGPPAGAPPRPNRAALSPLSASGQIARILYTGRGDANGALLTDGTIVRFPPPAGAALVDVLRTGGTLHATGWGTRTPLGASLEATRLGDSSDSMREVFEGRGGRRGGRAEPRGPRGVSPGAADGSAVAPPPPPRPAS